jgi:hypothetical protein
LLRQLRAIIRKCGSRYCSKASRDHQGRDCS